MTPDTESGHREIQELLPWWANGTLRPEESRLVEAHLERCATCRREALLLTELDQALEAAPGEETVEPDRADDPATTAVVAHRPRPPRRSKRSILPWLGWAAAAVLALALGLETGLHRSLESGPDAGPTRIVPTYRLDAVRRSSVDTVTIPRGSASRATTEEFQLLLHVDLGPGALPLDLVLQDSRGRTVFREPGIESLYDGRFLFLRCTTSEVPPGRYQVLLQGRGPDALEEPLRYSFRVVEGAGSEDKGSP